ncbi:MAG: chemotaxis protein CheD [Clostridiales bacterium]|jgi:chemotaxis protein CheD|nr:chemotaxis protein CheD [Clostridiales bacterium]
MVNKRNMTMVGMADMNLVKDPGALTTLGLGSCVGIALYDPGSKIAALAHCMLPEAAQIQKNSNAAKFVDTAIVQLVKDMEKLGALRRRIVAKLAGGAQMFAFDSSNESLRIGDRNVDAAMRVLKQMGIPVVSSDVRENYGRTVELFAADGSLVIKTIGKGVKTI